MRKRGAVRISCPAGELPAVGGGSAGRTGESVPLLPPGLAVVLKQIKPQRFLLKQKPQQLDQSTAREDGAAAQDRDHVIFGQGSLPAGKIHRRPPQCVRAPSMAWTSARVQW